MTATTNELTASRRGRAFDGTPGAALAILRSFSVQKMLGPELCFYLSAEVEGRGC